MFLGQEMGLVLPSSVTIRASFLSKLVRRSVLFGSQVASSVDAESEKRIVVARVRSFSEKASMKVTSILQWYGEWSGQIPLANFDQ